jgi:hypothetical protein
MARHSQALDARAFIDTRQQPLEAQIRAWFNHPSMGKERNDYKTLFGFLLGVNTREEALRENPDLTGVI